MRSIITPTYEKQLQGLAFMLNSEIGIVALQDTVEIEPVNPWPSTLRLCDPPETGWEHVPPTDAA